MDKSQKKIIQLTNDTQYFEGVFETILSVIIRHYPPLIIRQQNTYINYYLVSSFDANSDIHIFSLLHQKQFLIKKSLIQSLGHKEVLGWLFAFNQDIVDKLQQTHDMSLYGFFDLPQLPSVQISTQEELIQNSVVVRTQQEKQMRKASWAASLRPIFKKGYTWLELLDSSWNGISLHKNTAQAKAISECIERMSSGYFSDWTSWTLPLATDICQLFMWKNADFQAPFYSIQSIFTWETKSIPWNILYYPYFHNPYWNGNSNWVSCHVNKELAIENGLMEIIERDAYSLSWLLKKGVWRISKNTLLNKLIAQHTFWKYEIDLFLIHFDNPLPVVLSISRMGEKIVTSLGTGYDLLDAIKKSLSETWQFANEHMQLSSELKEGDHAIHIHIKHYLDPQNFYKVAWYYDLPYCSFKEAEQAFWINSFEALLDWHNKQSKDIYIHQYNNPILNVFSRVCLRVISSHYIPIRFGYKTPGPIIKSERVQYRKEKLNVHSLNFDLHPFG